MSGLVHISPDNHFLIKSFTLDFIEMILRESDCPVCQALGVRVAESIAHAFDFLDIEDLHTGDFNTFYRFLETSRRLYASGEKVGKSGDPIDATKINEMGKILEAMRRDARYQP